MSREPPAPGPCLPRRCWVGAGVRLTNVPWKDRLLETPLEPTNCDGFSLAMTVLRMLTNEMTIQATIGLPDGVRAARSEASPTPSGRTRST